MPIPKTGQPDEQRQVQRNKEDSEYGMSHDQELSGGYG